MTEISGQSTMDGSGGSQPEGSQTGQRGDLGPKQNNIGKIQLQKQAVYDLTNEKKLLKLAVYSACQDEGCKCIGWKTTPPPGQTEASTDTPCKTCCHILEKHISHLRPVSDAKLNRLLDMVVDVEIIYISIAKQEDPDTKRIFVYLYKLLRKCIATMTLPAIEGPLGHPPFETPNISKVVTNFVVYKFGKASVRKWHAMYELAELFVHCVNNWNCESPSLRMLQSPVPEALPAYKINYTRWLVFCRLPAIFDSLPHFATADVFGKQLLRAIFKTMFEQLTDNCHATMPPPNRMKVLRQFPKFLRVLEEEIYAPNSPIFDPEFKAVPPPHFQAI